MWVGRTDGREESKCVITSLRTLKHTGNCYDGIMFSHSFCVDALIKSLEPLPIFVPLEIHALMSF
jgi:hypothetical protein